MAAAIAAMMSSRTWPNCCMDSCGANGCVAFLMLGSGRHPTCRLKDRSSMACYCQLLWGMAVLRFWGEVAQCGPGNYFGKTLLDLFHCFSLKACHHLRGAFRGVSSAFDGGLELFKGPEASAVHWGSPGWHTVEVVKRGVLTSGWAGPHETHPSIVTHFACLLDLLTESVDVVGFVLEHWWC